MESERVQVMMTRAEIDTRAPFKSVKEAVTLFGEKVFAGELYNTKLKEMHNGEYENGHGNGNSRMGTETKELEETKESLEKSRKESEVMANCLTSLRQELEKTKQELQQLRFERELEKHHVIGPEIEDVKFVEARPMRFETVKMPMPSPMTGQTSVEFQKKRYVTFANPASLAQVVIPHGVEKLERHPSLKKKKKKPFIPLIGAIFSRKKPSPELV